MVSNLFPAFDHQNKAKAELAHELFDGYPQSIRERFTTFHQANPEVYALFKSLSLEAKQSGKERYSARTIIEVIRWKQDTFTRGEAFVINDNFTPIYARLLIHEMPQFEGFFELRRVRSKGALSQEQRMREQP